MHFRLKLDKMHHLPEKEFRSINWLPTSKMVDQCISTITFNFANNTCPYYLNEIFEFARHCRIGTRNNFYKLKKNPFRKTNMGQKTISYIGPSIWNSLPDAIKKASSLNTFKHNVKKHYLTWITHIVYMWICVGVCIYTYGYILVCFPFTAFSRFFFLVYPFLSFSFWLEGLQWK